VCGNSSMQRHVSRCNHVNYLYGEPIVFFNSGTGASMISQKKVRDIRFRVREYPHSFEY
jgi:hypothetical protein